MNILKKNKDIFIKFLICLGVVIILVLYLFQDTFKEVINIILISFFVAYILRPIKNIIKGKERLSDRTASIVLILVIIILSIISLFMLLPNMFKELNNLGPTIENLYEYVEGFANNSKISNSTFVRFIYEQGKEKISILLMSLSEGIVDNVISISENILSLAIIPVITYYFLADSSWISGKVYLIVPLEKRNIVKKIVKDIDKLLGRYIISQVVLSIIIAVLTFIILILLGVKFPLWLSLLNGIFNIIPYFGPLLGGVPVILIAMLDSPTKGIWTGIAIFLIQQIEGNILSPKVTGDSTNIHPLLIIILLLIGEKFGGFIGMILVIPIAVVIKVIYEDINYYLF
ncbi:AI-2E family transporter [Clostridium paraputrificum]|uniref:AI-2E family transporter n=1 Tax=Clostridium TaxID=1485 RepID=UPI003D34867C